MLQNAYLVAKIGADTAENEQHFAEIMPIRRRVAAASGAKSLTRAGTPGGSQERSFGTPPEARRARGADRGLPFVPLRPGLRIGAWSSRFR